jgi:hypothetical protein
MASLSDLKRAAKRAGVVGPRWGKKVVVFSEKRAWYAREDKERPGEPVVYAMAVGINAALLTGAARIGICGACQKRGILRADDYWCINCRGDSWLDED